jgi:F-type H+-transporting ATPase subunit epsilon
MGQFEILNDHAPIISTLQCGTVVFTTADGKQQLEIQGGFVEVQKNKVSLCVELKAKE